MSWIRRYQDAFAAVFALLLVLGVGIFATPTPPSTDSIHYLHIAQSGLVDNPSLAAPFAYRFGAPLIAGAISRIFPVSLMDSFTIVAFIGAWGVVLVAFFLATARQGGALEGFVIQIIVAFSFFTVKFALAVPTMVDVEGLLFLLLAWWALASRRFLLGLVMTCVGMFFKEFLVIPGVLIFLMKFIEYRKTHSTAALQWAVVTVLLVVSSFLAPRLTIPVTAGYGANLRWDFATPNTSGYLENLKFILSGGSIPGKLVNIVFAFSSFWLPVLLLATPSRIKDAWQGLGEFRWLCVVHVLLVAFLALVGGTNIMVFAAYSVPVLVLVLVRLFSAGLPLHESILLVLATALFNRIPWIIGGSASSVDDVVRFYGGWWSIIDQVTLSRTIEMIAFIIFFILVRFIFARVRRPIPH